jgi:hypothetical protein
MCASPAATSGNPLAFDNAADRASRAASPACASSSTPIHARSAKTSRTQRASSRSASASAQIERGQPQRETSRRRRGDVLARKLVTTLHRLPPSARDQLRKIAVTRAVGREQDELRRVGERELAADDERQAGVLRREMRADDTRERALVGERERGIALACGALDQLLRVRRAAQEREIRQAVQLGVGRQQVRESHTA